jgi:2,2-dialkylglycine decarboxylase (pyruvate)
MRFWGAAGGGGPEGTVRASTGPESAVPSAASGGGGGRLRRPGADAGQERMSTEDWLVRARRHCFRGRLDGIDVGGPVFERGLGSVVWDVQGKAYLDFNAGQMCSVLGHCHPRVVAAVAEQLQALVHASSTFHNTKEIELAERLAATLPPPLSKCLFALSGSDANEAALGIAKAATGRYEAASPHVAFHGLSDTPRQLTFAFGHVRLPPGAPGSHALLAPYCLRCPIGRTFPDCELACLDGSMELLDAEVSNGLAAIITEPLFSAGGVIEPPPGWLAAVAEAAHARGALLILDEEQTGLAKLGTMWAFESEGVVPDVLTVSKHLGGGLAISAVVTSEAIEAAALEGGFSYGHSHSNDPLACAAAIAVLETIEEEGLVARARELGARLRARLEELRAAHPLIGDLRGRGILQGVELVREDGSPATDAGPTIQHACLEAGLLFSVRRRGSVIRLVPPFSTTAEQIDKAVDILGSAFARVREPTHRLDTMV